MGESTVKIIENNSSTLKIESTIIGITAIVEFTIDSQGYNLTLVQETLGEKEKPITILGLIESILKFATGQFSID